MKKSSFLLLIIIIISITLLVPGCIDLIVGRTAFSGNVESGYWVEFFGGFIGAIIGALVSLIGISITIHYTNEQNKAGREFEKEQNKKEREANVRPYCIVSFSNGKPRTKKILGSLLVGCEPKSNDGPRYDCLLYIKNIGLGPAIEFNITVDPIEDGREHYGILQASTPEILNNSVSHLLPGDEALIGISFFFNFDPIREEDFIPLNKEEDPLGFNYAVKPEIINKYKNFDVILNIEYSDLYGNWFKQTVILRSNMFITVDKNHKTAEHKCEIYLKKTVLPSRMQLEI